MGLARGVVGLAIGAALLAPAAASAAGAGWRIAISDRTARLLIAEDSLARNGDIVRVKLRALFGEPRALDEKTGSTFSIAETSEDIDCAAKRYRNVTVVLMDEHMTPVETDAQPGDWQSITEGSPSDTVYAVACGRAGMTQLKHLDDAPADVQRAAYLATLGSSI